MVQRAFFDRFGHQGIIVLPDEVLSDDPLFDPETGEELASLREQVSLVDGISHRLLCYACVLRACGDGLYWANVAANSDLVNTHRVILTEEDLYFALPCDIRLQDKSPAHILTMMQAHAREVQPLPRIASAAASQLAPAPVLPLEPLAVVEVSSDELQEALGPTQMDTLTDTNQQKVSRPLGSFRMQQAFLRVILDTLMTRLYQALDQAIALSLKARCGLLALLQHWHRLTRQRVVNVVPAWSEERQRVVWKLTVGVPVGLSV